MRPTPRLLIQNGSMSEWLGTGLQNRSQRFESAWNLESPPSFDSEALYFIDSQSVSSPL